MKNNKSNITGLKKMTALAIYSLIPIISGGIVTYFISRSISILALILYQGLTLFVFIFSYKSVCLIEKSTVISFPYGTGRLENFLSFLIGAVTIPSSVYIIVASINKIIHPNYNISLGLAQILLIFIITRTVYITFYTGKMKKTNDSPVIKTFHENFRVGAVFFSLALIALFTAWMLTKSGYIKAAAYIDPVLAIFPMVYLFFVSMRQVIENYRVLIDLPLPEAEQLKILKALSGEFNTYDNIGNIYTRVSGTKRFIDVELYFDPGTNLEYIRKVKHSINKRLEESFPDLSFNLIPLCNNENSEIEKF
jgi:cation diffusion facilitator family transporter